MLVRLAGQACVSEGRSTPRGVIDEVKSIKAMIDAKMAERRQEQRNVKLGVGGIRELEFVVQAIQVLCGFRLPTICDRSTLGSLGRFRQHRLLTSQEQEALSRSYLFLRDVEHKLQMVHDLQTHALPEEEEELARCAIRLGYARPSKSDALERFVADYRHHTTSVNRLFRSLVESPDRSSLLRAALRRIAGKKRPTRMSAHR